ncbi:MAG: glycosyltransferase family 2 protein [Methylacidiphilales bacterium]|nr:glycosyltransferase family 2 protein [Candidatus Methylacidiphilales bacterium]
MAPPILSIVFSFRNEEIVIPELLRRCRAVCRSLVQQGRLSSYELIFVDDDSNDGSFALLKQGADTDGDIRILCMSRRFGTSVCSLAGMQYCCGDLVVYMDADLQDPPELIPELIQAVEKDPEVQVVHTKRLQRDGETLYKLFITRIGYSILHFLTNSQLPVECGDFKLLTRTAVIEVLRFKEKKPFMRWLICLIGFKQAFVGYKREARWAGETHFSVFSWKVISNFLESAVVSTSVFPLHLISLAGLISSLLCGGVLVDTLIEKIEGLPPSGWTALMSAVLFIGSVQILSIGLVGLYLASIFEEVKARPTYIVRQKYGFETKPVADNR